MALGPVSVLLPRKYLRTNLASRSNLWEGTQRDILGRFERSPKAHKRDDHGATCARDVSEEFTHRPWHENVTCAWDRTQLILQAENDYGANGLALVDELSDAISACIEDGFDRDIEVLSIRDSETG